MVNERIALPAMLQTDHYFRQMLTPSLIRIPLHDGIRMFFGRVDEKSGGKFMRAYLWQDGRVLGFDAVEWFTWLAAVNLMALITLAF
jgi:hypothetical protein